jgi:peptidyl-prolyl cis-trans isomerase SurA
MNRLFNFTLATIFVAWSALPAGHAQQPEVIDGVAAVVNHDVITFSQLREVIGPEERTLRDSFHGEELVNKIKELRLRGLRELIDRQLILQEFKKKEAEGASIPTYAIDERIQDIIRRDFGGDRTAFVRTLKAQGYTLAQFRKIQMDIFIVQMMRQAHVRDDFVISPTQIQTFYDKNKEGYSVPEQVKLRMIVIRDESDTGLPGGKKAMAEEIRGKLAEGAEFGRMAMMYSEDPNTQEAEGDWGWIDRKTLNEELSKVAFSLNPGQVSKVVTLGNSHYILMVEAKKNASVRPISEVRDEIERNLIQQEKMKEYQRWLDTLRQRAYIKIYS